MKLVLLFKNDIYQIIKIYTLFLYS